MSHPIKLSGKLVGGVVGPGGETTGYVLNLPEIDVDLSALERPALESGKRYLVFGNFEERAYPIRGRVQVLRAKGLANTAGDLSRSDLRSSVFLTGTLRTDIIRPGGETTGVTLVGATPEIDLREIKNPQLNQDVTARGQFTLVSYPVRGQQFVFKAKSVDVVNVPPVVPLLKAAPAAGGAAPEVYEGISDKFSLEDAILDAMKQVPPSPVADGITSIRVEGIGAEFGGIAGISRLKVAITATVQN